MKNSKKITIITFVVIIIAAFTFILINNKSKMEAKAKSVSFSNAIPVKVTEVSKMKLDNSLTYIGTTYPIVEVPILSETQGKVLNLHFNVGDYVNKGKLLIVVDTVLKYANYLNAQAAFEKAKNDLARYEKLFDTKSINEVQLEQAKFAYKSAEAQLIIAKKQLIDTKIYAPTSGFVTTRNIEVGSVVSPGFSIANIVDISSLKIKINVAEKDIFRIYPNQKVKIQTDIYPNNSFDGFVKSINSKADEAHTYLVEILMKNETKYKLKAGMFAKVIFPFESDSSLVIPREALIGSIKDPQVFVITRDSLAILKNITINSENDKYFGVVEGLQEGDIIVTNGQINLKNNSKVYVQ